MADVKITPKIQCDNCGAVAEKTAHTMMGRSAPEYSKPSLWGSCRIEGGRSTDSYGGKGRLDFTDLCPSCANAAIDAAASALKSARGEDAK